MFQYKLNVLGECLGEVFSFNEGIMSKTDCLELCQQEEECKWFTYIPSSKICQVSTGCPTLNESCDKCISGESTCKPKEDGKI